MLEALSRLAELNYSKTSSLPIWVKDFQKQKAQLTKSLGLPTQKTEEWRYVNLKPMLSLNWQAAITPDVEKIVSLKSLLPLGPKVVLVNGSFAESLSEIPAQVNVSLLKEVLGTQSPLKDRVQKRLLARQEADGFAAWQASMLSEGVVIDIPAHTKMDEPMSLVHLVVGNQDPQASADLNMIFIGESANVTIADITLSGGVGNFLTSSSTLFEAAPQARVEYVRLQALAGDQFAVNDWDARVAQGAHLDFLQFSLGGRIAKEKIGIASQGAGSHINLFGLSVLSEDQLIDHHTVLDHQVPSATSQQYFKAILADRARSVFDGRIIIRPQAQMVQTGQTNKNLMLSSAAEVDTKPDLQIYADNVKAAHGATIGQLNEDEVFYLESRGIPKAEAVRILARGFVSELVFKITNVKVRKFVDELLLHKFETLKVDS